MRKIVAGSYGRGVWEADLPAESTDVEDLVGGPVLPNLMLDPPYPNPVSGSATLRFAARSRASIDLAIFDVQGRRVETVLRGAHADGVIRMVSWSAEGLSDGIYLLRLTAGEDQVTRKVLVRR